MVSEPVPSLLLDLLELRIQRAQATGRPPIPEKFLGSLKSTLPENYSHFRKHDSQLVSSKVELANSTEHLLSARRLLCFLENVASVGHGSVWSHFQQLN